MGQKTTPTLQQLGFLEMQETIAAPDIERNVIGALIGSRRLYDSVSEFLNEELFSEQHLRNLFKAVKHLVDAGTDPDIVAVCNIIKQYDKTIELHQIAAICADASCHDLVYECNVLNEYRKKRAAYYCGLQLASRAGKIEESVNELIEDVMNKLIDTSTSGYAEDITMNEVLNAVLADVHRNAEQGVACMGSRTGFEQLDRYGGLKYSSLVVIAAESSIGKSSLALNFSLNALIHGAKIAFYSLEMTNKELVSRVLSSVSGVSSSDIMYSQLLPNQLNDVAAGASGIRRIAANMHFDDRSESNIDTILSSIRNKKKRFNIDGVILDYMQILNVNMRNANKEQAMGEVARKLKNIAKELNIWVVTLSQLNRDRDNPMPTLNRLRDSGQIVEAADEVILIYRPEKVNVMSYPEPFEDVETRDTAMLIKAKGRNTGTASFIVGFDASKTRFFELAQMPLKMITKKDTSNEPF